MILGFGFEQDFGVCGAGFGCGGIILGFEVQGLAFLRRFSGFRFWFFHTTSGFWVVVFSHQIRALGFGQKMHNFPSKIHYFHQKSDNLTCISPPARICFPPIISTTFINYFSMKGGDCVIMDATCWHGGGANTSNTQRMLLSVSFEQSSNDDRNHWRLSDFII